MHGFRPRFLAAPVSRLTFTALVMVAHAVASMRADQIVPEPLPNPRISGFSFPESEATLTRWITEMTRGDPMTAAAAFENIHVHGWGLWTALTAETAQSYGGQTLRVFETWLTPDDLAGPPPEDGRSAAGSQPRRAALRRFDGVEMQRERGSIDLRAAASGSMVDRVMGFVKFDPTAADHIVRQQLLRKDALDALLDGGAVQVPPFPGSALAIKPVFQLLRTKDLVQGRYHALKVWPGPPPTPRPWAPAHWPGAIWIDVADGGSGRGAIDGIALADGGTRTEATTYPISSLLHFRLSAPDADDLNRSKPDQAASAGDIAVLVAMHVSGREIARWTWQTFWWTPSPEDPRAPSSAAIASMRPPQLRGAARNYAMALAYTMLSPEQPYVGGSNGTPAVYAYNPWLEARLAPADLPDSIPGLSPDGRPAANNHGIQTNCMSCHAQANYNPNRRSTAPGFTGARYVDLGAAEFVGTLQVDFMWSIARHLR